MNSIGEKDMAALGENMFKISAKYIRVGFSAARIGDTMVHRFQELKNFRLKVLLN